MMTDLEQHRKWLTGLVDVPSSGMFVDLGCGRGLELLRLAERHPESAVTFLGLDASEQRVEEARRESHDPRIRFEVSKVGVPLEFGDATLDGVLTQDLLECFVDPDGPCRSLDGAPPPRALPG